MSEELNKTTEEETEEQNTEKVEGSEETTTEEPKGKEKPVEQKVDLDALTERIRKEEKDKLYASFEKYKTDAKEEAEARKAAEDKLKEYETKNLSAEEQTQLKLKEFEETNVSLREKLEEVVNLANDKINSLELALAKKEILSAYGEEIISEMVSGTTLEEVQASAEKAHKAYINIKEKAIAEAKKVKTPIGGGLNPSNEGLNVNPNLADIKKIDDPKEWEKVKAKLLQDLMTK